LKKCRLLPHKYLFVEVKKSIFKNDPYLLLSLIKVRPRCRRQRAVRHRFDSGHMKGGMYTEGTGLQKMNSRGDNNLGDGKWVVKLGGRVCGIPPGGADPRWKAIPSA
jgi:hypothetical protein